MLVSAMSSSSTGAWPHHSPRRWPRIRQVSAEAQQVLHAAGGRCVCERWIDARASIAALTCGRLRIGQLVEGRVAVHLVFRRVEVHVLVGRVAGDDLVAAHHPDAAAFLAARVDVARQLDRHLRVGRVQAAAVLVVEAGLAAHEHFPQRPFVAGRRSMRCHCLRLLPCVLLACARGPARPRAPRRRRPRPSRARPGARGCTGRRRRRRARTRPSRWRRSRSARASSFHFRSGSGSVTPSTSACSTVASTNFWRRSSLLTRLMPQRMPCARVGALVVGRAEHHQATATTSGSPRPAPSRSARRCPRCIITSSAS